MLSTLVRRPFARVSVVVAGSLLAAAAATVAPATSAYAADASMESQFLSYTNAARASAGLAPYSVAWDLVSVARSHSAAMAGSGTLYHNPSLASDISNWQAVGENVGTGGDVSSIQTAFMNSPEHRANILDHDFTQIGIGVVVGSDGRVWVTEDFRQPMGSATVSAPAPQPVTTTTTTTTASAPTGTTSPTRSYTPVSAAPVSAAPVGPSRAVLARQQLVSRLRVMRAREAHAPAPRDPVAQALAYASTLRTLTR